MAIDTVIALRTLALRTTCLFMFDLYVDHRRGLPNA